MATNTIDTIIVNSMFVARNEVASYTYDILIKDYIVSQSLTHNQLADIAIQFWSSGSSSLAAGQDIENMIVSKLALDKTSLSENDIDLFIKRVGYEIAVDLSGSSS